MESTEQRPWPVVPPPVPHSSKPLRTLANIVSYIFHPIFMPTIMAIALYLLSPVAFKSLTPEILKFRLGTVVLLTVFFPLFSVVLMKKLDFIQSIHMRDPKDRIIPLITIMIFYFWVQQVFSNLKDSPAIIKILMLGAFWGIILLFLVSIFFKVSMHATAAGGMVGILTVLLFTSQVNMLAPLLVSLVLAGIIGSARLILGEHRPPEIWVGYVLGFVVQMAAWAYVM